MRIIGLIESNDVYWNESVLIEKVLLNMSANQFLHLRITKNVRLAKEIFDYNFSMINR